MGSQQRAAAAALLLPLLLCSIAQQANSAEPLRMAIVNQVHFHLEVVAGAMHILKTLTSAPVTVYLPAKVMKTNWYGFRSWLGDKEGFIWKDCKEYDGTTTYDFVWFITPERDTSWVASVAEQMKPKLALYYVHNGHIPDADLKAIKELSGKMPLLTLSPHVSKNISEKAAPIEPVWVLPIFPYQPASTCTLQDLQDRHQCIKGFSVQGRIESSRRNYTAMWQQIASYRRAEGADALRNFRLNVLGESVEAFTVPSDVRDLVAVYKNPPYPIFYDVVYHSYALVPMLASDLYYTSKFSSTVLTSFITGVPIIADKPFMDAYTMIERNAVYYQDDDKNELDVMFRVARMAPEEMWRARMGLDDLRNKMNKRATSLLLGWLKEKGLKPDVEVEGDRHLRRRHRRSLLSPLLLLGHAAEQAVQEAAVLADSFGSRLPSVAKWRKR